MPSNNKYINTKEAAHYLGLAVNTLEKYRSIGNKGPKYYRISKSAIRYKVSDLDTYMEENCFSATCEYDEADRKFE